MKRLRTRSKRSLSFITVICMVVTTIVPGLGTVVYAEEAKANVIDVTEYGADPTGNVDSAIAIQKAIEAAKEVEGPVIINFPKGEYQIYPDKAAERELYISNTVGTDQSYKMKKIGILLENMKDVTVEGNDSLFNFHGKMTTFASIDCTNVTFQNYKVDFQVPTVVDVTVESVADNSATIYVPECYNYSINGTNITWKSDVSPYTGNLYWTSNNSMAYAQKINLKTGLTTRGGTPIFNNLNSIEELGNNRLKFNYSSTPGGLEAGICYQMRPTVRDHAGTFFWKSENVTMENLDIHFLHGFGMVGQSSTNIHMNDVIFETPVGSGRTTAGYADFVQMSGCKGEIKIENCSFANPHDDPINIHGTFMQVVERIAANKFKVRYMHNETAGFPNFFVGDEVEFMTKGNMIPVEDSTAKVTEVSGPTGNSGLNDSGTGSLTDIIITLDKDMPGEITANTHVVENTTYTPSVVIQNNIFKETPTRGILVTTRKPIVIKDNKFDGMGMAAIYISNDAQGWYESGPTKDVLIEGNTFTRSGLGTSTQPVIYVDPTNPTVAQDKTVHENIVIRDNTFYMQDNQALGAKSVKNITFENNRIYRYDPNVSIELSAQQTSLVAGDTLNLTTNATASSLRSDLFSFNGCMSVDLKNNLYDGGLKLNASTSNMTPSNVKVGEEEGVVVNGAANETNKLGNIYYKSSDESVLKVSKSGTIRAINAGEATVTAYSVVGGRTFESNAVTMTVQAGDLGTLPTNITLLDAQTTIDELGETVQYTANILPEDANNKVNWAAVDPITGNASTHATIDENGVLTTVSNGVVEVVATTVNGLEAHTLLVIKKEGLALNNAFSIINEVSDKWEIVSENQILLTALSQGLWDTQTAKNIVLADVEEDMTNVTATVKMSGKTKANYDEAGLFFYKDNDNYVSVERKHGAGNPKIHVVTEANRSPNEDAPVSNSEQEDIYFKLVKEGNTITGYYSEDNVTWTEVRSVTNASLGTDFKIGVMAANGAGSDTTFEFTNLTINEEEVSFTTLNQAPEATTVETFYNEEEAKLQASYTYADANLDAEGTSIVKWAISDNQDGTYHIVSGIEGKEITTTAEMKDKFVKAIVIPQDSKGLYGAPMYQTEAVQVTGDGAQGGDNLPKSANAKLSNASITGVGSFGAFDKNNKYYITTATALQETFNVALEAENKNATITLFLNNENVAESVNGILTAENVALSSGNNILAAQVLAEDGETITEYRFTVIRTGYNDRSLSGIKVGGVALSDFATDKEEYSYTLSNAVENIEIEAVGAHKSATVSFWANVIATSINKATVALKPGANKVTIMVKPDTSAEAKKYVINVKVPDENNANLEAVQFEDGVQLDTVFEAGVLEYTGTATKSSVTMKLVAEEKSAEIEVKVNGVSKFTETGLVSGTLAMKSGENIIEIKVTAPNKETTKTYKLTLTGVKVKYLSDMNYDATQSTFGYQPPKMDTSFDSAALRLAGEDGNPVTFEKGIGVHANTKLVYDLSGESYKTFSTYVGLDYESYNATYGDVTFTIYADGVEVYNSGLMVQKTPMKFVSIPVEGVQELVLNIDKNVNDYNDHADFADAKFTTDLEDGTPEPDPTYTVTVTTNNNNMGTAAADKTSYEKGSTAVVTATAEAGYEFVNWTDASNAVVSTDAVYSFTVNEDVTLKANFKAIKSLLNQKIKEADAIDLDKFLAVGKDSFIQDLANAKAVYKDDNATKQEVEDAYKKLQIAIFLLREKPDKSKLDQLMKESKAIKASKYTKESYAVLKKAIASAEKVYTNAESTKGAVAQAEQSLRNAINQLEEIQQQEKPGWKIQKDGRWRYLNKDQSYATNSWQKIDQKWYCFDKAGYMMTGWTQDNAKTTWYYLKSNGAMATGWQMVSGKWYYFKSDDSGRMLTGWQKVSGKWYFLNAKGDMAVGWKLVNHKWYYLNAKGDMAIGWKLVNNQWYYLNAKGEMKTGWVIVGGKWYYFNEKGIMLSSTSRNLKGKTYKFNANGVCVNP